MTTGKLKVQNILAFIIILLLSYVAYKMATQPISQAPNTPSTDQPVATTPTATVESGADQNASTLTNTTTTTTTITAPSGEEKPAGKPAPLPPFVSDAAVGNLVKRYPQIALSEVKWIQNRHGFEALFNDGKHIMEVEYDKAGNWLETEFEHAGESEIPFEIRQMVLKSFPNAKVSEYEIEHTAKGTFYEIELMENDKEVEKYYDAQGKEAANTNEDS